MKKENKNINLKVHVVYRSRDEQERRYAVNRKLADIINFEENGSVRALVQ